MTVEGDRAPGDAAPATGPEAISTATGGNATGGRVTGGNATGGRVTGGNATGGHATGRRATGARVSARARTGKRRRAPDPARTWARGLVRRRPGLLDFVLAELAGLYGEPAYHARLEPVGELVLTILAQNTADINAERAFEALRAAYRSSGRVMTHRVVGPDGVERAPEGWGGVGLASGAPPDWAAVEAAPLPELMEVIRPGGLAAQKAPRIQAALRSIRERNGSHDLGFLAALPHSRPATG